VLVVAFGGLLADAVAAGVGGRLMSSLSCSISICQRLRNHPGPSLRACLRTCLLSVRTYLDLSGRRAACR